MTQITNYFNAEKFESLFFVGFGILAIAASLYFFTVIKTPFYKGMAISLFLIALIQITVGSTVYFRSPKDIIRVENIVKFEKSKIQTEEIPRMNAVMKNFVLYRWIEIGLIVLGLIFYFYFGTETMMKGIGFGLFIQSGVMLFLDYFAEKRGFEYLVFLTNL